MSRVSEMYGSVIESVAKLRRMGRVRPVGTRQKAHIHVQARAATSMSPHGSDGEELPLTRLVQSHFVDTVVSRPSYCVTI